MGYFRIRHSCHLLFASAFLLPVLLLSGFMAQPVQARTCPDVEGAKAFFKIVRSKIHRKISASQLNSYNCIFKYWSEHNKLKDRRWLSYSLATAWHESHMHPVREGFGGHARAVRAAKAAWDAGWPKRPYHVKHPRTGKVYYGRGLVQITYAENYLKLGRQIGIGDALYKNPDLALDPEIATKLMFLGMVKGSYRVEKRKAVMRKCGGPVRKYVRAKLGLYFNNRCTKWTRARNMINGDIRKNGGKVARIAKRYRAGLSYVPRPVAGTPDHVKPPVIVDPVEDETPPEIVEPEIRPIKPGDEGQPDGPVIADNSIKPEPENTGTGSDPVNTGSTKPPVEKEVSDEKVIKPVLPGDEPDGAAFIANAEAIVKLRAANARQVDLIKGLQQQLSAQGKLADDNKRLIGDNAKTMQGVSAKLSDIDQKISVLMEQMLALTRVEEPASTSEHKKPKGWFKRSAGKVKGFLLRHKIEIRTKPGQK